MSLAKFDMIRQIGLDCIDSCLINILNYKKLPYEFLFYNMFYFSYKSSYDGKIAANIHGGINDIKKNSYLFFQLCFSEPTAVNAIDNIKEIDFSKCQYLAGVRADACFWRKRNQILYDPHYLVVLGHGQDGFLCADPQLTDQLVQISDKDFKNIYVGHFKTFFLTKHRFQKPEQQLAFLLNQLKQFMECLSFYNSYQRLINDLTCRDSLVPEFEETNHFMPMFEYLLTYRLPGSRYYFTLFLEKFYALFPCLENRRQTVLELSQQNLHEWKVVKGLIQKIKYSGLYLREKPLLLQRLTSIMEQEEQLIFCLREDFSKVATRNTH